MNNLELPAPDTKEALPARKLPPDERFWKRYSPHHEFSLSSVVSASLHVFVVALLIFGSYLAVKLGWVDQRKPVALIPVAVNEDDTLPSTDPTGTGRLGSDRAEASVPGVRNSSTSSAPPPPVETLRKADLKPEVEAPATSTAAVDDRNLDASSQAIADVEKTREKIKELDNLIKAKSSNDGRSGENGGDERGAKRRGTPNGNNVNRIRSEKEERQDRWKIFFGNIQGDEYLRRLRFFEAYMIFPNPRGSGFLKISNMNRRPVKLEPVEAGENSDIYWRDDHPSSVSSLAQALGLRFRPPFIASFFPKNFEDHLASLEKANAGTMPIGEIRATHFKVVPAGIGKYEIVFDRFEK